MHKKLDLNIKWSNNRAHFTVKTREFCMCDALNFGIFKSSSYTQVSECICVCVCGCVKTKLLFKWLGPPLVVGLWLNLILIHVILSKLNMIIELTKQYPFCATTKKLYGFKRTTALHIQPFFRHCEHTFQIWIRGLTNFTRTKLKPFKMFIIFHFHTL